MNKEETLEYIKEKEKEGKITFMTIEGLMSCPLTDFIKQPAMGVLYDLNRDKLTTITLATEDNLRWINDYAVAVLIEYLIKLVNDITDERNEYKKKCEELENKKKKI